MRAPCRISGVLAAILLATFIAGPAMSVPRVDHSAVVLHDGRVLFVGGNVSDPRCEIYDPATRSFRVAGSMARPRYVPAATLLADGRVLITAGQAFPDFRGLPFGSYGDVTAEIFDPLTETFTPAGDLHEARYRHASTLLQDGRVLVSGGSYGYIGGFSVSIHPRRGTEIYDPATNAFTRGPDMAAARWEHSAILLKDGRVLLAGLPDDHEPGVAGETFDGTAMQQAWFGTEPRPRHTATLLPDGRAVYAGHGSIDVVDPVSGLLSPAGKTTAASDHAATILPDGRVLLAGGRVSVQPEAKAEIFDPETRQVRPAGSMLHARYGHTATLLRDGTVLIAGGRHAETATEIYGHPIPGKRRAARK